MLVALVLLLLQATTGPQPLPSNAPVPYPERARVQEVEGPVSFEIDVDDAGVPRAVRVTGVPVRALGIEEDVSATLMTWKFQPARREGVAVSGTYAGIVDLRLTLPAHVARMYAVTPEAATAAVEMTLKIMKAGVARRERKDGLLVTKPIIEGDEQVVFDVFIPPRVNPARVYVTSVRQQANRSAYNVEAVNERFYTAFERELKMAGEQVPLKPSRRVASAQRLVPGALTDSCTANLISNEKPPAGATIQPPQKFYAPDPLFPGDQYQRGADGTITIEGRILEDGFFWPRKVLDRDADSSGFVVSALAGTSRWRFRPALLNGCPVVAVMTVTVNYRY